MDHGDASVVNTLEEMQSWGTVDPVPYEYGYDKEGADGGVSIRKDPEKFFELISKINVDEAGWCRYGTVCMRQHAM